MYLRKILVAHVIGAGIVGQVHASEASTWEGFYTGLSIGQRTQTADWQQRAIYDSEGPLLGEYKIGDNRSRDSAVYSGLYGGYNWVFKDAFIAGVELSAGYADNESAENKFYLPFERATLNSSAGTSLKSNWDAKLKGRFGYLVTSNALLYGSAGLAVTHMKAVATCSPPTGLLCYGPSVKDTTSRTLHGWTAGLGVEAFVTEKLMARFEYEYTAYNRVSFMALRSSPDTYNISDGSGSLVAGIEGSSKITTQALKLGLSYKF